MLFFIALSLPYLRYDLFGLAFFDSLESSLYRDMMRVFLLIDVLEYADSHADVGVLES